MSYFEDLSDEEKEALEIEFLHSTTTDERRTEILKLIRDAANEAQIGHPCPRCKNYPFFASQSHALLEGHVYSQEGSREVRISGYCEFCFDLIMKDPDDE